MTKDEFIKVLKDKKLSQSAFARICFSLDNNRKFSSILRNIQRAHAGTANVSKEMERVLENFKIPNWTYAYTEMGGYDFMTDAVNIYYKNQPNLILSIDMADFGQQLNLPVDTMEALRAKKLAKFITTALNEANYEL